MNRDEVQCQNEGGRKCKQVADGTIVKFCSVGCRNSNLSYAWSLDNNDCCWDEIECEMACNGVYETLTERALLLQLCFSEVSVHCHWCCDNQITAKNIKTACRSGVGHGGAMWCYAFDDSSSAWALLILEFNSLDESYCESINSWSKESWLLPRHN